MLSDIGQGIRGTMCREEGGEGKGRGEGVKRAIIQGDGGNPVTL